MMQFIPLVTPPSQQHEHAWWFIFKQNDLLVQSSGEMCQIPYLSHIRQLGLEPVRIQYLGTLDGTHCFSAEISSEEVTVPDGMSFQPLRPLFNVIPEDMFWLAGRAIQIIDWDRTHQYCGRCGHQMGQVPGERAKICPECQLTQYPRLSPAIIVAVVKDDQILLANSSRFSQELYSVIAGFVEPGETFEDCVRREVKEEVGIEVKDIRYFGSQPWPFPNSLMVGFTAKYAGGDIAVDHVEVVKAGWFTSDNLPMIPGKVSIARKLIDWFIEHHPQPV